VTSKEDQGDHSKEALRIRNLELLLANLSLTLEEEVLDEGDSEVDERDTEERVELQVKDVDLEEVLLDSKVLLNGLSLSCNQKSF